MQNARNQQIPAKIIPLPSNPPETQQASPPMQEENKESELKKKILDLEQHNSNLENDLKMTITRQREAGASANEALRQLESEISKYF